MVLSRHYWDIAGERRGNCEINTSVAGDALIEISMDGRDAVEYRGSDFEIALEMARRDFEAQGRLLLINRFRRDAFVTSMARQMSNGLSCYLVAPRKPVDPSKLVQSLDPADEKLVVTENEARIFIARWQSKAPWGNRFLRLGWMKGPCD